jgi:two-component system, OmpR family, response regulator
MPQVLLIDDDVDFVALLKEYLQREGFDISTAHNGEVGIHTALQGKSDIAVLDVMMPGMNGIEVLKRLRTQTTMPVLMLTAKDDYTDRIVGLELGADDYVAKPCPPREILARIRAILRRTQSTKSAETAPASVVVGSLVMWPEKRRAEFSGQPLPLTSTEFSLLELLARNAGTLVSKDDLSQHALGRPLSQFDRSIDVHLSSIRQKLGPLPGQSIIRTVFRKGYQLIKE